MPRNVYKGAHDTPVLGGFIKIEIQRQGTNPTNGVWEDVTGEVLALGIAGRNLADGNRTLANRWNNLPDGAGGATTLPRTEPNAIIRLQRVRDIPVNHALAPCGITERGRRRSRRSARTSTTTGPTRCTMRAKGRCATRPGGLDRSCAQRDHALRRARREQPATVARRAAGAARRADGANAKNDNGYIVYFSDRRGNKNDAATPVETGEFGFEDNVNPATTTGAPNNALDVGEDVNGSGTLELYGRVARNSPGGASTAACLASFPNPMRTGPIAAGGTSVSQVLTNVNTGVTARQVAATEQRSRRSSRR